MSTPEAAPGRGRETRLLLVTIAVSVGVLLLLARFRFPEEPAGQTVESAPAPLERLAARAAYDELASIMADLDRRITPRVTVLRTQGSDGQIASVVAPRLLPDRAVAIVGREETIIGAPSAGDQEIIARDSRAGLAVMRVPAVDDSAVTLRQGAVRPGPRYVAVVEATAIGPATRPAYVGRMEAFQDPHTGATLLSLAALQHEIPRGAALFTLEGLFIGLVRDSGPSAVVVPADVLRHTAQSAEPTAESAMGDLGIDVDTLTASLSRATGAEQGVIVVLVHPGGPADGVLQSGDVIQSLDGSTVSSLGSFRELERSRTPGAEVAITGMRNRAALKASVRAAGSPAPAAPASPTAPTSSGSDSSTKSGDQLGFVGRTVPDVGTEIVTVAPGSTAARAGLRRGDLIHVVDGEKAPDAAALARRFRAAAAGSALLLTVQRGDQYRVIALERR